MTPLEEDKLILHFFNQKMNGMSFSEVRRSLENQNTPEKNIKNIICEIDDLMIKGASRRKTKSEGIKLIVLGTILILVSLIISFGTYYSFIDLKGTYIIVYGPFFTGGAMLTYGLNTYKKNKRKF